MADTTATDEAETHTHVQLKIARAVGLDEAPFLEQIDHLRKVRALIRSIA